jgi:ABC-2 type transport system permease protein
MINIALYKKEFKRNLILFLIFLGLILLYGAIVSAMFDPNVDNLSWIQSLQDLYPELLDFIGFNFAEITDYQYFISGYLYGMLFILFGIIYANIISSRLIYRYIDQGSIVFLLSTPNSRKKVLLTQIFVVQTYLFLLALSMFLVTSLFGEIFNPGYVDFGKLFYLNLSFFILLSFISSLMILCHSIFEGKKALGFSIGLPVLFFFLNLITNLGNTYKFVVYFTPFSLFDPILCINYSGLSFIYNGLLILLTLSTFGITIFHFNKRDLSV